MADVCVAAVPVVEAEVVCGCGDGGGGGVDGVVAGFRVMVERGASKLYARRDGNGGTAESRFVGIFSASIDKVDVSKTHHITYNQVSLCLINLSIFFLLNERCLN